MTRTYTDAWLCSDCTIVAANGDYSGIESDERIAEVDAGLEALGEISANWDSETDEGIEEFSWRPCDACGSSLGGDRTRFAVWQKEVE